MRIYLRNIKSSRYAFLNVSVLGFRALGDKRAAASLEHRQEGQPPEGAPCYLKGAGSEGVNGVQCVAGRLQEKSGRF